MATGTKAAMAREATAAPDILTVTQAAAYMGVSAGRLYQLVRAGKVPCAVKLTAGMIVFPLDELEAWLARGGLSSE